MWLLFCTLLTLSDENALSDTPSFEEMVTFIEQNPLPAFLLGTDHFKHTDQQVLAFLAGLDQTQIKKYREDAAPKWRALGLLANLMENSPKGFDPLLEVLTDESPLDIAPPFDQGVYRLNDFAWHWLDMALENIARDSEPGAGSEKQKFREKVWAALLDHGDPKLRDQLLLKHTPPSSHIAAVRELADAGERVALPALARFGDAKAAALIAEHLDDLNPNNPAWLAASLLPDPRYLPFFAELKVEALLPGAAQTNHQPVFTALAAQNNQRARHIADALSQSLSDATPDHTKLVWDLFAAFTHHPEGIQDEAFVLAMVRRHHIINHESFDWFARKDPALAEELCFSIWSQTKPIYQDGGYIALNFWYNAYDKRKPQYKAIFDDQAVNGLFPKRQHPHVQKAWEAAFPPRVFHCG